MRLSKTFQVFANSASLLVVDEHMLSVVCELAISTVDVDYFLVKVGLEKGHTPCSEYKECEYRDFLFSDCQS